MIQLSTPSEHDSDDEAYDALDDLFIHVLDISPLSENEDDTDIQTGVDELNHESTRLFYTSILQCSVLHTITRQLPLSHNATARFHSVMIDTGDVSGSTGGLAQYHAYCTHVGCHPKIDAATATTIQFGNVSERSQGTAFISFSIGEINVAFAAHILQEANVPY